MVYNVLYMIRDKRCAYGLDWKDNQKCFASGHESYTLLAVVSLRRGAFLHLWYRTFDIGDRLRQLWFLLARCYLHLGSCLRRRGMCRLLGPLGRSSRRVYWYWNFLVVVQRTTCWSKRELSRPFEGCLSFEIPRRCWIPLVRRDLCRRSFWRFRGCQWCLAWSQECPWLSRHCSRGNQE